MTILSSVTIYKVGKCMPSILKSVLDFRSHKVFSSLKSFKS